MLLEYLIESLEEALPLTVIGKFPENSAVRAFRRFDRKTAADDLLYVLFADDPHPDGTNDELFKGRCILYNPSVDYASPNCITIHSDVSDAEFSNAVQDIFEEEYTVSSWFHSIYTMAVKSRNPAQLLSGLRSVFHNHFLLMSSSLYVVDGTLTSYEGNPHFEERHGRRYLSARTIEYISETGILDRALKASSSIEVDDPFFGCRLLLANIRLGSYIAGYFITIQTEREFTLRDPAMVTFLAEVMGQMIYSNTSHLTERYFNDEYFLQTLLSPEGYDVDELAGFMHWDRYMESGYYRFLVCSAPGDIRKKASTHMSEQLRHIFPSAPVLVGDTVVTVFFAGNRKELVSGSDMRSLRDLMKTQKQNAVLSFCFSDLTLAASYHGHSVSLLNHMTGGKNKSGEVFLMEDNYFRMVTLALQDGHPDSSVIHPDILFLKKYDEKHNSELMKTLSVYLECNRNVAEMSKVLHINKSTGFYRINQIRDLLDDPFSSSQKLFYYECAMRILGGDGTA